MLSLYKKSLDVGLGDNVVNVVVYDNSLMKRKNGILKHEIRYTTCNAKQCEYKKECPMTSHGLYTWCVCPHGQNTTVTQPRSGSKKYVEFKKMVNMCKIRRRFGEYSDWIYNNTDRELTLEEYEYVKNIDVFKIRNMTEYWKSNHEFKNELENISSYALRNVKVPSFSGKLFTSFRTHLLNEYDLNTDKLTREEKKILEFEKTNKNLFRVCGDYLFLDIPWLHTDNFEHEIFKYKNSGGFTGHNFNLILISDVIKYEKEIFNHLISNRPHAMMGGEIKDYQLLYVPLIKKLWSPLMEKISK